MFKSVISLLLISILFIFNGCEKKIVDTDIPQMYILNLRFRLADANPLEDLNIADIENSITSSIKDPKTDLSIESFTIEEEHYLRLTTSVLPSLEFDEISYSIQNINLFGDNEKHIITVKWVNENNTRKIRTTLLDQHELKIEKDKNIDYYMIAN
jgi:hypothetical protein